MRNVAIIVVLLLLTGADKPPVNNSPPPPSPSATVNRAAPQSSVWRQIQGPLDRSSGRIVDEPTFQLHQIRQSQDEQRSQTPAQSEADRFRVERERQLRLDQRAAQQQNESRRDQPLTNINPDLGRNVTTLDPSPVAGQAMADEMALSRLRNTRDKQLTAANQQRLDDLKQRPSERDQINAEYQSQVDQIGREFETERNAILDYRPAPTTQP